LQNNCVTQILVVDDCSTDSTITIAEGYARSDGRVTLMRTERNSGAGVARNMAIPYITGDYCVFIDADDIVVERGVDKASTLLHTMGSDFLVYKWYRTDMYGRANNRRMAESDEFFWAHTLRGKRILHTDSLRHPQIMLTLNFPWNEYSTG
jgi:glycosyltransferase involved in cell wall biosynthesis